MLDERLFAGGFSTILKYFSVLIIKKFKIGKVKRIFIGSLQDSVGKPKVEPR